MFLGDHEVLSAATGGARETASLVRGDFISKFDCLNKHLMGSDWGRMLAWEDKRGYSDGRFGRVYVLPVLFEVSFCSC